MRKFKDWINIVAPKILGVIWVATLFSISLYVFVWSIKGIIELMG